MEVTPQYGHRPWHLIRHMMSGALAILPVVFATLGIGMAIYHFVEGLDWSDSFLNASMLLGGMGPVSTIKTTAGKWLAGSYALFAGLVVIVFTGVMLAPAIHHVLTHKPTQDPDS